MEYSADAREYCRTFERYSRHYHAGAFATPLTGDMMLAMLDERLHVWPGGSLGYEVNVSRDLHPKDFTGAPYRIPAGSRFLKYVANPEGVPLPDLAGFTHVFAYQEDPVTTRSLREQGFMLQMVRITPASEIIGLYERCLLAAYYPLHDLATLCSVPFEVDPKHRAAIEEEVTSIGGWRDDFPYYNKDGSWGQVVLRGFRPEDPYWGVKPAEMDRKWKAANPDELEKQCDWTVICDRLPATMELIRSIPWWRKFERVRLLRMYSTAKEGKLLRHTDITDRDGGTADGKIARFHMPITSHPDARTTGWDLDGAPISLNLKPWSLYYLDQRKPHQVTVPPGVERIHLVPDIVSDETVREVIASGLRPSHCCFPWEKA